MLGPSVLPEHSQRRKAWEQAHGLAAQSSAWPAPQSSAWPAPQSSAWPAEHSEEEAAHSQPSPPAVGNDTAEASTAPSTAAAEAAACDLITVKHSQSLTSSSGLDNATAEEPAIGLLKTPSIVQSRCKRYERAGMSSESADQGNSRMLDRETGHVTDKGKKSAASVTDKHSSEAPCPSPSDESNHPKQPVDQQENGDDTGGVKKRKVITVFGLH